MRYEQRLIWVLGITFGFLFFDRNAASFLMPFIARDLSFTNQQVGLIASALSFTWAVSALLGGAPRCALELARGVLSGGRSGAGVGGADRPLRARAAEEVAAGGRERRRRVRHECRCDARPSQHAPVCAHEHLHGRLDGARVGLPAALLRQGAPVIGGRDERAS